MGPKKYQNCLYTWLFCKFFNKTNQSKFPSLAIIALIKVHHILGVTMSPCPAVSNDKEDQSATLTGPLVMSKYLINAIPLYFPGPHMFLLKFCAKS